MNRSFGNNCKAGPLHKDKKTYHCRSTVEFQTIFKARNDHSILKTANIITKKKQNQTESSEPYDKDHHLLRNNVQQEIKNYVKSLRKPQKESAQESKDPAANQILKSTNQHSEPVKCHPQPPPTNPKKQPQNPLPCEPQTPTLDTLQKKLQQLLQLKLFRKCQNKTSLSLRSHQDDLQKQLQMLIQQIQQYSEKGDSCTENMDVEIRDIVQKIGMLEKIIAESFTESQILKKYFYMRRLSKKPMTIFGNQIRRNFEQQVAYMKNLSYVPQHPSLHYSSISQSSYSKPPREAYQKQSKHIKSVVTNRQNLGRSSYQAQYLNYGPLPNYPPKKETEATLATFSTSASKSSVYQNDFKEKKVCLEDSKTLDCRRDKFRPTPITFMPKKLMNNKQNARQSIKKTKTQKNKMVCDSVHNGHHNTMSFSSIYKDSSMMKASTWLGSMGSKTEYSTNFAGEKSIIDCLAKQTNLTNLKYEFRRNVNA